ncbi:hypothetical protein JOQ06_009711, partial [Pogonophryne albipinna]
GLTVCHAQFSFWFSRVSLPLKSVGPSLQSEPHCIGHGCQCWLPVDRWSIETKIISWLEEELLLKVLSLQLSESSSKFE